MRIFKNTILFSAILSFISFPSFASDTTVYPPANQAAGGGILYFPAGGESSLYAVPVISDDLTAAIKEQTEAIKDMKDAVSKASGIQCTIDPRYSFISCINTVTGKVCYQIGTGNAPGNVGAITQWVCPPSTGWNP